MFKLKDEVRDLPLQSCNFRDEAITWNLERIGLTSEATQLCSLSDMEGLTTSNTQMYNRDKQVTHYKSER
jgi:hypothetical protein